MSAPNLNRQRSRELMERSRRVVAGGISSQIRLNEPGGEPLFFDRSEGALMWDADGNEYIDYIQGMGPNIFGHAPEFVSNQVSEDMRKGYVFAAQFERELEVAEMAADAVPIEDCTVRFASSGTEIDQLALRLARGYTGRTKYIRFEGHYHGWMDSVNHSVHPPIDEAGNVESPNVVGESAGMDPGAASQVIPCQWNDPDRLEAAFDRNPGQVAAVIMEPINANTNCIMPEPGYLEAVNEIAHRHGALVIFDEVITGFRVAYGGAQELLGITPDLATYAKSIAAGFPIAMLAG
ncbi:MAG: aminotransferase class III-fold pyridoxal phosphate-dependent enzyme, partial [Chloroflexi bacterium]|nr:aminotransferase class III-fold pyridoxal phosphate-dependent enzyme [Chloroflexota bacterium]